ncbi:hypothetical protein AOQ84DRAFT_374677 [Glonium stellatum]|uniref:Ankyrin repeat protein n=1 Tax=Glonium stellatum TaxID=574774 RepID=A0A8E2JVH6_9PEZI|nr:hypothetical protein AOQ84DRAFT_374677 [Glonium stellatum]
MSSDFPSNPLSPLPYHDYRAGKYSFELSFEGWSAGDGIPHFGTLGKPAGDAAFLVCILSQSGYLKKYLKVRNPWLRQLLCDCYSVGARHPVDARCFEYIEISYDQLLAKHETLESALKKEKGFRSRGLPNYFLELRLLVEVFIPNRHLFVHNELQSLGKRRNPSNNHLEDTQQESLWAELYDIATIFDAIHGGFKEKNYFSPLLHSKSAFFYWLRNHKPGASQIFLFPEQISYNMDDFLQYVLEINKLDIFWSFLKQFPNANLTSGRALFAAAQHGHFQAATRLIQSGVEIDLQTRPKCDGQGRLRCLEEQGRYTARTPLWAAIENGHLNIAKFLLSHGANVAGSGINQSLLTVAIKNRNRAAVELLLAYGATPSKEYISAATKCREWDIVNLLQEHRVRQNLGHHFHHNFISLLVQN